MNDIASLTQTQRHGAANVGSARMNGEVGKVIDRRDAPAAPAIPRSKEVLRFKLFVVLVAFDALALALAFVTAALIRYDVKFGAHALDILPVVLPVYLVLAFNNRAYSMHALAQRRFGIVRALLALTTAVVAIVLIGFYLRAGADLSRIALGSGTVLAALGLVAARAAFHPLAQRAYGGSPLSIVVITDKAPCPVVDGAALLDAGVAGLRPDISDPIMLDRLGRFLKNADRVVVACEPDQRHAWAMTLKGANIRGEIVEPAIAALGTIGTDMFGEESTVVVSTGALGVHSRIMKRMLDLSLVIFALFVAAPAMLLTALLIRLEDGGPALFVQERLGRGNRLFRVYKFRSMKHALCDRAGNVSTSRDDDRITRVGRFIRRTSIDELPQLFNILKGDMSFVGPRPHALGSLAGDLLFWEVDQRYWHRHASKPGLTGLAQVRGFRGATAERSDLVKRLQADLEYMNDWTIGRDVRILLATMKVLFHKNAF